MEEEASAGHCVSLSAAAAIWTKSIRGNVGPEEDHKYKYKYKYEYKHYLVHNVTLISR